MKININLREMTHLKEKSFYNKNYYKCGNMGMEILQVCHEDYNFYEYFIVDGDVRTFLGCGERDNEIELLNRFT